MKDEQRLAALLRRILTSERYTVDVAHEGSTGLGLSIVHGIAKVHDGFFELTSTPGRGTTAILTLPAINNPTTRHSQQWQSTLLNL